MMRNIVAALVSALTIVGCTTSSEGISAGDGFQLRELSRGCRVLTYRDSPVIRPADGIRYAYALGNCPKTIAEGNITPAVSTRIDVERGYARVLATGRAGRREIIIRRNDNIYRNSPYLYQTKWLDGAPPN